MRHIRFAVALSLLILLARAGSASIWRVSEMQPDVPHGGRANTIAVSPASDDVMIVASESGGLFRSTDRGVTWRHLDGMPEHLMNSVAFHPMDANVVIATTVRDFKATNGGGIWRSADGGTTWSQVASPPPPSCPPFVLHCTYPPVTGNGISIAPDDGTIYVATTYGLSRSTDRGVTWTHLDPFGSVPSGNPFGRVSHTVADVLALQNDVVLIGGNDGVLRSLDDGATWRWPVSGAGSIQSIHSFTRSPFWIDQAYAVNSALDLYYTENGGDTWTKIANLPPGGSGCGGIPFVKAQANPLVPPVPDPINNGVMLWYGNRCWLWTLFCPQLGARSYNYSGTWQPMAIDHIDTRDLAFESRGPALLLATDGGLHKTTDGGTHWVFAGGGHNGYNALQIYEVKGQTITALSRYDLYFGTQDNWMWASRNGGRTWPYDTQSEGWFIDGARRVRAESDSTITYQSPSGNFDSRPLFTAEASWPEPQTPVASSTAPIYIGPSNYVEGVNQGSRFLKGMAYTTNLGTSWQQYTTFPEDRWMQARLSKPAAIPVLVQPIRTGLSGGLPVYSMVRITGSATAPTGTAKYPLMTRFGGLGIHQMAWIQPAVFAVDPANSMHLIAADVINEKMMETKDGGKSWLDMPSLTSLVTDSGRFLFRYGAETHASAISFNPDNPLIVAVGTHQGGILISEDRGARWTKVAGSERVTRISAIEWKSASEATVSTYGRGLWRLSTRWILNPPLYTTDCKACTTKPFAGANPNETYTRAILVFNGRIQGARAVNGVLQELFVTPASSVAFFTDSGELENVTVTESETEAGFTGATPPATPNGQSLVGVTLGKTTNLLSASFTSNPLVVYEPTETEKTQDAQPAGSDQSPIAGKPYVSLNTNRVEPGVALNVNGTGFAPLVSIDLTIDDTVVAKLKTSANGTFSATITAPAEMGSHMLYAIDSGSGNQIDGAQFSVMPEEEEE
jgi:photosystem II stability/assembly factor-like uncharacterized protein